jgi:ParB family transcriptional regulator, chromosome partitioning protein
LHAAWAAFSRRPQLSLDEDRIAHAGALAKRTRLAGAFLIDVTRIRRDPRQPRKTFDTKAQVELTASIERLGILQPITVRYIAEDDVYQVITGERRLQAANAAGVSEIPCWVQTPESKDILVHQIVENWQRSDLHPYDLANALAALRDASALSQKELSKLTGKPESEISRYLKLLTINPAAQEQARRDETGTISKRHLVAIADLPASDQPAMIQTIQETKMTATET